MGEHLGEDPGEKFNVAQKYPDIVESIRREVSAHVESMTAGENQLAKIAQQRN